MQYPNIVLYFDFEPRAYRRRDFAYKSPSFEHLFTFDRDQSTEEILEFLLENGVQSICLLLGKSSPFGETQIHWADEAEFHEETGATSHGESTGSDKESASRDKESANSDKEEVSCDKFKRVLKDELCFELPGKAITDFLELCSLKELDVEWIEFAQLLEIRRLIDSFGPSWTLVQLRDSKIELSIFQRGFKRLQFESICAHEFEKLIESRDLDPREREYLSMDMVLGTRMIRSPLSKKIMKRAMKGVYPLTPTHQDCNEDFHLEQIQLLNFYTDYEIYPNFSLKLIRRWMLMVAAFFVLIQLSLPPLEKGFVSYDQGQILNQVQKKEKKVAKISEEPLKNIHSTLLDLKELLHPKKKFKNVYHLGGLKYLGKLTGPREINCGDFLVYDQKIELCESSSFGPIKVLDLQDRFVAVENQGSLYQILKTKQADKPALQTSLKFNKKSKLLGVMVQSEENGAKNWIERVKGQSLKTLDDYEITVNLIRSGYLQSFAPKTNKMRTLSMVGRSKKSSSKE